MIDWRIVVIAWLVGVIVGVAWHWLRESRDGR